ncbi:HobA family DNA replication regulator [Campylobacter troglodytis]|uniref:HobA family DNA replication regulator n=1 Tax=Campylobacter troglodytis TaxID=654363 RepID=UPI001159C5F2|nr:HobA family DNA replication regulator [Campylobacter troglodytis]TQR60598.1 hypothetical protein DMC01_05085 [Campylobacter troglodytis]
MDYLRFLLETIRSGGVFMSWLEARRLEFAPLMSAKFSLMLEGKSFVLICDEKRAWYERYFLQKINAKSYRPFVPIFSLDNFYAHRIKNSEDISLLNDLLETAFPNGFVYFYVGEKNSKNYEIARSRDESLLWLFDEQLQNSFFLDSKDANLDEKLITLYKLFDKSLDAVLFSKVSL